jgi:DNA-binding HxlR family transcriptional regulator
MLLGHTDDPHSDCMAAREVLNRVGDKWSLLIISMLGDGTKRFNEMKRSIEGISQRMLTLTLRVLERDGLVKRTVYPTVPPRVDYELTPLGQTLLEPVKALVAWAQQHRPEIRDAQVQFDLNQVAIAEATEAPQPATAERAPALRH